MLSHVHHAWIYNLLAKLQVELFQMLTSLRDLSQTCASNVAATIKIENLEMSAAAKLCQTIVGDLAAVNKMERSKMDALLS
tara:strand:- start:136 stop:378 length:243 start_codon:yes stop_codon:yes gene_type:complete